MSIQVDGLKSKISDVYLKNLKKVMHDDMVEDYMTYFSSYYDQHLIIGSSNNFDYTSPGKIKPDVMRYVRAKLLQGVAALSQTNKVFRAFFPDISEPLPDDQNAVKLFHFYVSGTPGTYVALTKDHYAIMTPYSTENAKIGRFGNMHLMEYSVYEDMYMSVPENFRKGWPRPSDIIHPYSNFPPVRIFESANTYIMGRFSIYTKKAAKITFGS